MLIQVWMMLVLCVLVFTVATFLYPKQLFLPLLCFALWNSLALYGTTLTYIGFGSVNVITQTYELGDPELPAYIIYFFHGIGILMLVWGIGMYMGMSYDDLKAIGQHKHVDTIRGND